MGGEIVPHHDGLDLYNKGTCLSCGYKAPVALFQLYHRAQPLYPARIRNGALTFETPPNRFVVGTDTQPYDVLRARKEGRE